MKDTESASGLSSNEQSEVFYAKFTKQQGDLEKKIESSKSVPPLNLKEYFSELNIMLQELQKFYSISSPYLRIYYRKICQDALQDLQGKITDAEAKLMPRKKFMFRGSKSKNTTPLQVTNEDVICELNQYSVHDGPEQSNNCVIQNHTDETLTISPDVAQGKTVILSKLRGCQINVLAAPNTVTISDVQNCSISLGPVTTSVFVESADVCVFQLACQQLRIHQTTNTDFFIHVTSKAIIEDSHKVRFGTYSLSYPALEQDFEKAGLDRSINNWRQIDDFNWLVAGQPSPNWSLMETEEKDGL